MEYKIKKHKQRNVRIVGLVILSLNPGGFSVTSISIRCSITSDLMLRVVKFLPIFLLIVNWGWFTVVVRQLLYYHFITTLLVSDWGSSPSSLGALRILFKNVRQLFWVSVDCVGDINISVWVLTYLAGSLTGEMAASTSSWILEPKHKVLSKIFPIMLVQLAFPNVLECLISFPAFCDILFSVTYCDVIFFVTLYFLLVFV